MAPNTRMERTGTASVPNHLSDKRAITVAQAALAASGAELVILFGSRSRGDYDELESDIDILIFQEETDKNSKETISRIIDDATRKAYGRLMPVQTVWTTPESFRHNRRYNNSVETNAVREGIIMPRNPENYSSANYEDEETEYEHDWSDYENRLSHAETHLAEFKYLSDMARSDLVIGQQAQNALEHGLKALIAAHGAEYPRTHNIGTLIGKVREHDPRMQNFQLRIHPDIYTEYAGGTSYSRRRNRPKLTEQEDYLAKTMADAKFIIDRAQSIYEQTK